MVRDPIVISNTGFWDGSAGRQAVRMGGSVYRVWGSISCEPREATYPKLQWSRVREDNREHGKALEVWGPESS